jgi:ankyrin repeat protein
MSNTIASTSPLLSEEDEFYYMAGHRTNYSILHECAFTGRLQLLLDNVSAFGLLEKDECEPTGAGDVGEHDECLVGGKTVLHWAVYGGHVEVVRMLLDLASERYDGDVAKVLSALDDRHQTSLHMATLMGRVDIARILLEAGADPNVCSAYAKHGENHGNTPAHVAVQHGFIRVLELLVEFGADLERPNAEKRSVFEEASYHGMDAIADTILSWRNNNE